MEIKVHKIGMVAYQGKTFIKELVE